MIGWFDKTVKNEKIDKAFKDSFSQINEDNI